MTHDKNLLTNSYDRDPDSNALLAVDQHALQKHKRQKQQKHQLQEQADKIESLEQQVQNLQQVIDQFLENNNAN